MTSSPNKILSLYSPFPSLSEAEHVASRLLSEKLIACANIIPGGRSIYMWEGKSHHDEEVFVFFKSQLSLKDRLIQRLGELHPYEVPAIIQLEASANTEYSKWLREQTS